MDKPAKRSAKQREDARITRQVRAIERRGLLDAVARCTHCGGLADAPADSIIKRGALLIFRDPLRLTWRGQPVKLSPSEALILSLVAIRGRASFDTINTAMVTFGIKPKNRSVLIWRIRDKFAEIGAQDPFETLGKYGLRFLPQDDQFGSKQTVIGLRSTGLAGQIEGHQLSQASG